MCVIYSKIVNWERRKSVDAVNRFFAFKLCDVKSRKDNTGHPLPAHVPVAEEGLFRLVLGPPQKALGPGRRMDPRTLNCLLADPRGKGGFLGTVCSNSSLSPQAPSLLWLALTSPACSEGRHCSDTTLWAFSMS